MANPNGQQYFHSRTISCSTSRKEHKDEKELSFVDELGEVSGFKEEGKFTLDVGVNLRYGARNNI